MNNGSFSQSSQKTRSRSRKVGSRGREGTLPLSSGVAIGVLAAQGRNLRRTAALDGFPGLPFEVLKTLNPGRNELRLGLMGGIGEPLQLE